jgi:hypothetical protein
VADLQAFGGKRIEDERKIGENILKKFPPGKIMLFSKFFLKLERICFNHTHHTLTQATLICALYYKSFTIAKL